MSFKTSSSGKPDLAGVYGVCNCINKDHAVPMIELMLNENNTFSYIDNTNAGKKINTSGNRVKKGNRILLKDYESVYAIHKRWRINHNNQCINSRKGLNFRRLCFLKPCR